MDKNKTTYRPITNLFLARWSLYLQLIVTLVFALLAGWLINWRASKSVMLGGAAWILPSILFSIIIFSREIAAPKTLLRRFFFAEAMKLLFSFGLIILIIKLTKLNPLLFFCGYIAALLSLFLLPLIFRS